MNIKLNKFHLFLLVIVLCLLIYIFVWTNQETNPLDSGCILNNFNGSGVNTGTGGGEDMILTLI